MHFWKRKAYLEIRNRKGKSREASQLLPFLLSSLVFEKIVKENPRPVKTGGKQEENMDKITYSAGCCSATTASEKVKTPSTRSNIRNPIWPVSA